MSELTNRQVYIIKLMCNDYAIKQIALKLKCSVSLIEKELNYLRDFYYCKTNTALIFKYLKNDTTRKN